MLATWMRRTRLAAISLVLVGAATSVTAQSMNAKGVGLVIATAETASSNMSSPFKGIGWGVGGNPREKEVGEKPPPSQPPKGNPND